MEQQKAALPVKTDGQGRLVFLWVWENGSPEGMDQVLYLGKKSG